MSDLGSYNEEKICQSIGGKHDGKLNGDNVDMYVRTNDMRVGNNNQDYHFFASNWTVDRIDTRDLDDIVPLGDVNSV